MAVPSGKYELTASLDLSPVFGIITSSHEVDLNVPGPEILDEHLKSLESPDANVRTQTLYQLRYFKQDAERVAVALVAAMNDENEGVRSAAMSVFMAYPDHAKKHLDVFLAILAGGGLREKYMACQLLSRIAPVDDAILAAMENAAAECNEGYKLAYKSLLDRYRQRVAPRR